jgi:hypothetical protein
MPSATKQKLQALVEQLIAEGEKVKATERKAKTSSITVTSFVDPEAIAKWAAGCRNFMNILGKRADAWKEVFQKDDSHFLHAKKMMGTLMAVKEAIDQDFLVTIDELVMSEAFADLLEQAEYLLSGNYFLAAGVLGRAVLEERLRKWCDNAGCVPTKPKPTLNDFKMELQKASQLTKIEASHVDAMAAIGNTAAHNKPGLTKMDVERLVRDVREFLLRHPS